MNPLDQSADSDGIADVAGYPDGSLDVRRAQIDGYQMVNGVEQTIDASTAHTAPGACNNGYCHSALLSRSRFVGHWRRLLRRATRSAGKVQEPRASCWSWLRNISVETSPSIRRGPTRLCPWPACGGVLP